MSSSLTLLKICQLSPLNTVMILEVFIILSRFALGWVSVGLNLSGWKCLWNNYSWRLLLFFPHVLFRCLLHYWSIIGKNWCYGFPEFFVVRNTFDINITNFSLVWWSNLTQIFLCSSDFFLLKLFLRLDLSIIERDLVVKTLLLKRRTFTLTAANLFKISRKTAWKAD